MRILIDRDLSDFFLEGRATILENQSRQARKWELLVRLEILEPDVSSWTVFFGVDQPKRIKILFIEPKLRLRGDSRSRVFLDHAWSRERRFGFGVIRSNDPRGMGVKS